MPKKKFIDKKNSITFHLVHRSQKDPLTADERAPKHVLVPVERKLKEADDKVQQEEQRKYGIFFDDDYNYLQHLRDANEVSVEWEPCERFRVNKHEPLSQGNIKNKPKVTLPSSVFASSVEEDVGLLNKAAPHSGPRLDYDPDIVAAMDEDFDYDDPDNQLQDDFISLANASPSEENGADEEEGSSDEAGSEDGFENASWDEELDEVRSLSGLCPFAEEETKSRFTEYSMSSSVIRRNEQLTLLDSRFEKMFESYDDTEIGALETEEIEGDMPIDNGILMQCADEFEKERCTKVALKDARMAAYGDEGELPEEDEAEETVEIDVTDKDDRKWDCESILSTYSNIYNHPKLIQDNFVRSNKIKISSKTGVPLGVLRGDQNNGLTSKGLAALDKAFAQEQRRNDTDIVSVATSAISQLSFRPKEETTEEKKLRKQAVKNYRKERRMEKKANSIAFKEEKKKQEKILLNNKQNIYNVKII